MPRPQFGLRALLLAMLVVAAFFGGVQFERARLRLEAEAATREDAIRVYPLIGRARLITLPDGTKHLQPVAVEPQEKRIATE